MDKAQKELIKTYYHARNISVGDNAFQPYYRPYEVSAKTIEMGLVDLEKVDMGDLSVLFINDPEMIKYVDAIPNSVIATVLGHRPEMIDQLDTSGLNGLQIKKILERQPSLVDQLDTNRMNTFHITALLQKHPQLFNKLNWQWLDADDIVRILTFQPQLMDDFDYGKFDQKELGRMTSRFLRYGEFDTANKFMDKYMNAEWSEPIRQWMKKAKK